MNALEHAIQALADELGIPGDALIDPEDLAQDLWLAALENGWGVLDLQVVGETLRILMDEETVNG